MVTNRCFAARDRQQGSMLIVAMMVLTLLMIIGVTFAALMKLESRATENFKNSRTTELIAGSAESSVIAMLRSGMLWDGYTRFERQRAPWIYGIKTAVGDLQLGGLHPLEGSLPSQSSLAATIGGDDNRVERFKTKVIDAASQININGEQDSLADMLLNLGQALVSDEHYKSKYSRSPFFTRATGGRAVTGEDIIRYRIKIGGKFHSKSELRNMLGETNYNRIADFITANSWMDPKSFGPTDGLDRFSESRLVGGPDGPSTSTSSTGDLGLKTEVTGSAPKVGKERRAPININTAPKPVLMACIMGLGGRRPFPYVDVRRQGLEEANRGVLEDVMLNSKEELFLRQQPVWVYSKPFDRAQADLIADQIIVQRKRQPFMAWRTTGQGAESGIGFENWVHTLDDTMFPNPNTVRVVDPLNPRDPSIQNKVTGNASSPSGLIWSRGHSESASARRGAGLAYSSNNAWYYDMMRSILIANFNPNVRSNKYNPNRSAYAPVDKSNLIKLDNDDPTQPIPGNTTEFCFDSNGVFEITTLAEMAGKVSGEDVLETAVADADGMFWENFAEVKRRTVVKVWEVMRHTTQEDFETPFNYGQQSSQNREYVTTYPDPISALHEDFFFGSNVDGRVELSGYSDALRQSLHPSARLEAYRQRTTTLLAHGFRFRSEQSRAGLRRLLQRRLNNGEEYLKEISTVLDPEYSGSGVKFQKRYSKANWGGATDSNNEAQQVRDATVSTAALGSDLMPDGIHSSIFRNKSPSFLRFPASVARLTPGDQGQIGGARGKNDIGNMAYYHGGVAFWVKFEFDPEVPVFCGLFSSTQVQTRVGGGPTDSEGTQWYIFKNTNGELRVSRLYYHQAFLDGNTSAAVPAVDEAEDAEGGGIEGDPQKLYARRDYAISLKDLNWKGKEWHHVMVEFNDEAGAGNGIRMKLDFEDVSAAVNDMGDESFCALNVEEPKDEMYIGAFFRKQAVASEGIFKFNTNFDDKGVVGDQSVKRIMSNATIDEFVSFSGGYVAPYGPTGYFTDRQAKYVNGFEIPFPEGVNRVRLRSLTWSVQPPLMYASSPVTWRNGFEMKAYNIDNRPSAVSLIDPGSDSVLNENLAGRWVYAKGDNLAGRVGQIVYEATMRGATGSGPFGGKVIGTPVLEDVTLSYYLPSAQVLVSEVAE